MRNINYIFLYIWLKNWKVFHRTSIILLSISLTVPFEIIQILLGAVQNIGVSFSSTISWAKGVFGVGACILLPWSKRSISSQAILKSFKNIISASSTPTQLKVPVAGWTKAIKIVHKRFIKKVFAQLVGPTIKMLPPLPRPFTNRFITAIENSSTHELLRSSVCYASSFHWPLQSGTHSPFWA